MFGLTSHFDGDLRVLKVGLRALFELESYLSGGVRAVKVLRGFVGVAFLASAVALAGLVARLQRGVS